MVKALCLSGEGLLENHWTFAGNSVKEVAVKSQEEGLAGNSVEEVGGNLLEEVCCRLS